MSTYVDTAPEQSAPRHWAPGYSQPGHRASAALESAAPTRNRLAAWTLTAALALMLCAVGGSLYEHLVVDPVWSANVAVIQPERGGVDRKLFWIPLHVALTLTLPLAIWACWRAPAARRWLFVAVAAYVAMRVWTMIYFVPRALQFEAHGFADAGEAQTWIVLSMLRLPLVLVSAAALGRARRRLDEPEPRKGYKGLPLEGFLARWYARNTAKPALLAEMNATAHELAAKVPAGSRVLEVAPGPGYLAIALAQRGDFRITGLDISKTFVALAGENAKQAGVDIAFEHGDAACMPFAADSFDFIVCRAAFKNFTEPVQALQEMHRVLRPGGQARIIDLGRDTSLAAIDDYVNKMGLGRFNTFLTKRVFRQLVKRAYSGQQFQQMASQTPFQRCDIVEAGIGLEVTLAK